jgi:hypothetical protein
MTREEKILQTQFNTMVKKFIAALVKIELPQNESLKQIIKN